MDVLSLEIKSKIDDPKRIESLLKLKNARFIGEDRQIDTYFSINNGRLKLRQGKIENTLIYYQRPESKGIKRSIVKIQKLSSDNEALRNILDRTIGILTVVDKKRKIFFIDNVKFHIDDVRELGSFIEIEALDTTGNLTEENLKDQCEYYIDYLHLDRAKFIDKSYSDMVNNHS